MSVIRKPALTFEKRFREYLRGGATPEDYKKLHDQANSEGSVVKCDRSEKKEPAASRPTTLENQ